jgi:hypothetical protein
MLPRIYCFTIHASVIRWALGFFVAVLLGHVVTERLLFISRRSIGLGPKPHRADSPTPFPPELTGIVERIVFTIFVGVNVQGVPTAMVGWLGLKLLSNWNRPLYKESADARTFVLSAAVAGLISMAFPFIGGLIASGRLNVGI